MFDRHLIRLGAAGGLALAGCGGGSDNATVSSASSSKPTGAGSTPQLKAGPGTQLRFDKKTLSASAGNVALVLSNPTPLSHNISIQGPGVNKSGQTVGNGGTSKVSATLKPGTYTFYCSVAGHREAGMQGTLTVR